MQTFVNTADGSLWQFEDNVIARADANGVYSFGYTTGARKPDIITPATYAPDTLGELGEVISKGKMLTPETVIQGDLIEIPLPDHPTTLKPQAA